MAPCKTEFAPTQTQTSKGGQDVSLGHGRAPLGGLLYDRISHSIKDKARNRRKGDESSNSLHYCDIVDSSCFNTPATVEERGPDTSSLGDCHALDRRNGTSDAHYAEHNINDPKYRRHETFVAQNAEHYKVPAPKSQ